MAYPFVTKKNKYKVLTILRNIFQRNSLKDTHFTETTVFIFDWVLLKQERGEMPSMRLVDLEGQKAEVPAAKSQASNKQAPTKNQGKNKPKVNSPPAADDPTNVNGDDKLEAEVCQTMLEVIETSLRHKINLSMYINV